MSVRKRPKNDKKFKLWQQEVELRYKKWLLQTEKDGYELGLVPDRECLDCEDCSPEGKCTFNGSCIHKGISVEADADE